MSLSQTDKAISPQLLVSDVKKSISHIYTCERFETKVFVASHAYSMCSQSQSRNLCTTYIELKMYQQKITVIILSSY